MTAQFEEASLAQLAGDCMARASKLMQAELALARAEVVEKFQVTGSAVKFLVAGAGLLIPAIVVLLLALSAELMALGLSPPLAYLSSGLAAAIVAGALIWIGLSRLSPQTLIPAATINEVQRDKALLSELTR